MYVYIYVYVKTNKRYTLWQDSQEVTGEAGMLLACSPRAQVELGHSGARSGFEPTFSSFLLACSLGHFQCCKPCCAVPVTSRWIFDPKRPQSFTNLGGVGRAKALEFEGYTPVSSLSLRDPLAIRDREPRLSFDARLSNKISPLHVALPTLHSRIQIAISSTCCGRLFHVSHPQFFKEDHRHMEPLLDPEPTRRQEDTCYGERQCVGSRNHFMSCVCAASSHTVSLRGGGFFLKIPSFLVWERKCPCLALLAGHEDNESKKVTRHCSKRETWRKNSEKVRKGLASVPAWSQSNVIVGMSTAPRVMDLVDVALASTTQRAPAGPLPDLIVDVSQDVGRRPWTLDSVRSITTSSDLVSISRQRSILPQEHYRLLGYPDVDLEGQSLHSQRDLSGEAMAPPSISFVLAVALATLQHKA